MLAKQAKYKIVIYTDIYKPSCIESAKVAEKLGLKCDYYIHGDIDKVITFVKENKLNVDVLGNYDVIEHIYDIRYFLSNLKNLSNHKSRFLASGANGANPKIKLQLKKLHYQMEYLGREYKFGRKPTDATQPLLKIREQIIREELPELDPRTISMLAKGTRGLIQQDILKATSEFLRLGKIPKPYHPTNTCDPLTGNWYENIHNPFQLKNYILEQGFNKAKIIPGKYFTKNNLVKVI